MCVFEIWVNAAALEENSQKILVGFGGLGWSCPPQTHGSQQAHFQKKNGCARHRENDAQWPQSQPGGNQAINDRMTPKGLKQHTHVKKISSILSALAGVVRRCARVSPTHNHLEFKLWGHVLGEEKAARKKGSDRTFNPLVKNPPPKNDTHPPSPGGVVELLLVHKECLRTLKFR